MEANANCKLTVCRLSIKMCGIHTNVRKVIIVAEWLGRVVL